MTRDVWSCSPNATIDDAMRLMRRHRVRRLPVVDGEWGLVGLLSIDDLVPKAATTPPLVDATEVVRTLAEIYRRCGPV